MTTKGNYIHGSSICKGDCKRPLRPERASLDEYPGTVKRVARGMCKSCWRQLKKDPIPRLPKIHPCANCGVLTRPVRTSEKQHPGTTRRVGELCRSCDSAGGVVDNDRLRYVAGELEAFNQWRRNRGIPPEGISMKEAS